MEALLRDILAFSQAGTDAGDEWGQVDANVVQRKALSNLESGIRQAGVVCSQLSVFNVQRSTCFSSFKIWSAT
jgi:hypothetical protein